jgi:hypothetical protein
MDMHKKTILPDDECALVSKDNGEGLELLLPSGVLENAVESTVAMYYLAVCYYRFLHDKEFVQAQMDWLNVNAKDGLDFGEYRIAPTVTAHQLKTRGPRERAAGPIQIQSQAMMDRITTAMEACKTNPPALPSRSSQRCRSSGTSRRQMQVLKYQLLPSNPSFGTQQTGPIAIFISFMPRVKCPIKGSSDGIVISTAPQG